MESEKTILKSDKINKLDKDTIKAIGDVEIKKGNRILNAEEVEYNQTTKTIKANSEVKIYDEKADALFYSQNAKMSDDFLNADFYNAFLIFENGTSIETRHISRFSEDNFDLEKGRYNLCPTKLYDIKLNYDEMIKKYEAEKTSLFSVRSYESNLNLSKKMFKLKHATIWVWKIPIFYLPYLKLNLDYDVDFHGFETPGFENTKHYGYGIYMPYKLKTKNINLRLSPKIYQKGNYLLNTKFNFFSKDKFNFTFKNDITNDNNKSIRLTNAYGVSEIDEGNYKQWRGYATLNGFYNFNDLWDFTSNSGISSDRYYLRDYYQDNLSYIESNFSVSRVNLKQTDDFNYFQFSNLFYQNLLEKWGGYNIPRYAPVVKLNLQDSIYKNDIYNLYYKVYFNSTELFRTKGIEYNRFSMTPSINNNFKTDFGNINIDLELISDFYALNEIHTPNKQYKGNKNKVLPQINFEWKKTFATNIFTIQPILKYSGSPKSSDFEDKVPNEDSVPQSLSFENIFSNNRFVGYDRQEYGNRITYGFEGEIFNAFGYGLAQGYRDDIDKKDTQLIGFEKNVSDYVGYLSYIFNDNLDIYYRFLTDKDDYTFKENKINLNVYLKNIDLFLIYTEIKKNELYAENQQQINSGITINFLYNWKLYLSGVLDLKNDNRFLESQVALRYSGNCTFWQLTYKSTNPLTETNRNRSIDFSFGIKFK